LVDAAEGSEADQAILDSCIGLFFFGVSNGGYNNKNLLSLVKDQKNALFVHNLMENSDTLRTIYLIFLRNYKNILKSCFIVSFLETQDTKTVEVDISQTSKTVVD